MEGIRIERIAKINLLRRYYEDRVVLFSRMCLEPGIPPVGIS